MEKKKIDFHPILAIIQAKESKELLMEVYDQSYPLRVYRGSANLIGGNPNNLDLGPLETLLREINEELCPLDGKENSPHSEDLHRIKQSITKNLVPFKDFYFYCREIVGGRKSYSAIGSVFYSTINQKVFELARKNINKNRKLLSEGELGIFRLKNLIEKGKFSTAHLASPILNDYFKINIPFPRELHFQSLSKPRSSFEEYFKDFSYKKGWRNH